MSDWQKREYYWIIGLYLFPIQTELRLKIKDKEYTCTSFSEKDEKILLTFEKGNDVLTISENSLNADPIKGIFTFKSG